MANCLQIHIYSYINYINIKTYFFKVKKQCLILNCMHKQHVCDFLFGEF